MESLKNKNIVLARAEEPSIETINYFKNIGANFIRFPSLEVVYVDGSEEINVILKESKIDYLLFQSENSVKFFLQLVKENNLNINYENLKVACYGKKTVALCRENQIKIDLLPVDLSAKGLIKLLSHELLNDKLVVIPNAVNGVDVLTQSLLNFGATVKTVAVYDVKIPKKETVADGIEKVKNIKIDWCIFTSPESYNNFLSLLEITDPVEFFKNCKIASIGQFTKQAIEKTKVPVDISPKKTSITHVMAGIQSFESVPRLTEQKRKKNTLKEKTIVLTRAEEQSRETINFIKNVGANLISFPALEIVPIDATEKLNSILEENKIDYLVFQSANAVKYFIQLIKEKNLAFDFEKMKVACVGKKTAALCQEHQIKVDMVPEDFSSLGLIKLFAIEPLENKTVLLPRSAIGRDELREGLKRLGAIVKTVAVYDVTIPSKETVADVIEKIRTTKVHWYLFTSPSTYQNFLALMEISKPRDFFNGKRIAAIGPTTREAIEKTRVRVDVVPERFTITHAIASMELYLSTPQPKKLQKQPQHFQKLPNKKIIRYVLKKRKPKNEN